MTKKELKEEELNQVAGASNPGVIKDISIKDTEEWLRRKRTKTHCGVEDVVKDGGIQGLFDIRRKNM